MTLQFVEMKDIVNLHDGDPVSGVCYAAAAEQIIQRWFNERDGEYQPTVIGYLVDDDNDVLAISDFENAPDENGARRDRDKVREVELVSQTRIKTDYDLLELGAIRRRLGRGVV